MQRECVEVAGALEDVEAPGSGGRREPCFRWFVVLENDSCVGDSIGFRGEQAGGREIRFLLFSRDECSRRRRLIAFKGCLLGGQGGFRALQRIGFGCWGGRAFPDVVVGRVRAAFAPSKRRD